MRSDTKPDGMSDAIRVDSEVVVERCFEARTPANRPTHSDAGRVALKIRSPNLKFGIGCCGAGETGLDDAIAIQELMMPFCPELGQHPSVGIDHDQRDEPRAKRHPERFELLAIDDEID